MIYFWGFLALLALSASALHIADFFAGRGNKWASVSLAIANLLTLTFAVINMAEVLR